MADLETATAVTPETIFESGSVAKQFTATAVLLLARDGKLRLDDDVRKYLPEVPAYDRPITIRNLLTHTSGLREWSTLVALSGWPRGQRAHTQADLLDVVYHQKALNYPVGDYYSYTNSGYAIAMSLVERLSGKTFQQFMRERIFTPLGLTHTQWRDDFTRLVPGRAQAYQRRDDGWHLNMPFESVVGPGGLLTTVGDWLTWNDAIAHDRLFPGHADSLAHRMRLTSGREIQYAIGVSVSDYRGVREVSHSGSTAGYSTFLARFPDRGNLSVAVLCNFSGAPTWTMVHRLADHLVTNFPVATTLDTSRVELASLARYYGIYRHTRTHGAWVVDSAALAPLRALPNGWLWSPYGDRLRFDVAPSGRPERVRIADDDGDTTVYVFEGGRAWKPTRSQLQQFVGRYRSDELGVTYNVRLAGDSLTMSERPGAVTALRPTYTDAFETDDAAVWFTRDRAGNVTAMHFGESRVWDLLVPRVASAASP